MADDNFWKLCSKKCGRPIDIATKYKTCCKACVIKNGYALSHHPVCDVRYHEYKQSNDKIIDNNDDIKINVIKDKDNNKWRCVLCNWDQNKSTDDNCQMCSKPQSDKKRKRNNDTIEPPFKRQKTDNNHNINNNNIENNNNSFDVSDNQTWKCSLCTFINDNISLQCNICQTEKNANINDENVLKRLKSQRDELEKNNNILNDSFDVADDMYHKQLNNKQLNDNINGKKKKKRSMKEEMDSDDETKEDKKDNINNDESEHESDDDIALEMFKNGLTPNIVRSQSQSQHNNNINEDSFDIDPSMEHLFNKKNNTENDLLFALSLSEYLKQSGFTYIINDVSDRYITDIIAESALSEEEYWNAHTIANIIPFIDTGDEIDNLINGFDHGSMAIKTKQFKNGNIKSIGSDGIAGDNNIYNDDEIDEYSVERVNIQREFQYAMQTGKIVRCRLIKRRLWDDNDDGDAQFRICESQFMRSCNRSGISSNGMQKTLKEVIYVINPQLIQKFQSKKNEMKRRLGSSGVNTILAWHGTPNKNIDSIVENNFSIAHLSKNSGDTGWYGAGIYFSEFANVSQGYGDGLLLCKIMLGKTYKMKAINVGCDQKNGYDSHMAAGTSKYGTEIVIFDVDQILPCYIAKY